MYDAITDVPGIQVGQAQDAGALTGCSVVLCGEGAVVGVDVRGLAPGTRETDICRPGTLVERAQAILLAGGSAFGLDAAAGVMRFLRECGLGFETGVMRVPIVPAAVLFDLGLGEAVWPDAEMGYEACRLAGRGAVDQGNAGAGMGATVGKILGIRNATKSGIGTAALRVGDATVGALIAVNAVGDVVRPDTGGILAGARDPETGAFIDTSKAMIEPHAALGTNTTIGVVATDAALTSEQTHHLAAAAHDGLARTIRPVHTLYDGDTIFALSTALASPVDSLRLQCAAVAAVERAIVNAVSHARSVAGLPAAG